MHRNIVETAILALMDGLENEIATVAFQQWFHLFAKLDFIQFGFEIPWGELTQFFKAVSQIFSRAPVDQKEVKIGYREYVNFARCIFDD